MSESNQEQKAQNLGILAGLAIALFFFLVFWPLDYSVPFRLLLASACGISGGWIVVWWNSKEPAKRKQSKEISLALTSRFGRRAGIVEVQRRLRATRSKRGLRRTSAEGQKTKA